MNTIKIISQWINALLTANELPYHLFQQNDFLEDGMDLEAYWHYEKNHFNTLAPIYDLTEDFSIDIIAIRPLTPTKSIYFFYLYNSAGKIVYKMNQTIEIIGTLPLLSGNNFLCQIVPKFIIKNNSIIGYGLAIHSPLCIKKIINPLLSCQSLYHGANFEEDQFYSAVFSTEDHYLTSIWHTFFVYLENSEGTFVEKRPIFFDNFKPELFPLKREGHRIVTIDNHYPVNLALYHDKQVTNYSYPRNCSFQTSEYSSIIVTDVLDNDWQLETPYLTIVEL